MDLRRRREEREPRKPLGLQRHTAGNPHLLLATGFVLGVCGSPVFYIGANTDPFSALLLGIVAVTGL